MTPCELKLWRFIALAIDRSGIAPSYQEIADGCGHRSKSTVARIVNSLEDQGIIVRHGRTRGINLLQRPPADTGTLCVVTIDKHGKPMIWLSDKASDRRTFATIRRGLDHAEPEINAIAAARLGERAI